MHARENLKQLRPEQSDQASVDAAGVVLHLGKWEAMGVACLAIGYPVAALYMPEPNRFEERIRAKMQRHGAGHIDE